MNKKKRVLVLEDDPDQANGMIDELEFEGYEVVPLERSDEVRRLLDAGARFDAFVLDYSVAPYNSVELMEIVGSGVIAPERVVMVTAYENQNACAADAKRWSDQLTILIKPDWVKGPLINAVERIVSG